MASAFSRKILLIPSIVFALSLVSAYLVAQEAPDSTPMGSPLQMHLCTDQCEKLVWKGSYYDGIRDANGVIYTHYTVKQWSKGSVQIYGKTISPVGVNMVFNVPVRTYLEGTFTGPIAADGHSIENGVVAWKMGMQHGERSFTLTWEPAASAAVSGPACSDPNTSIQQPTALEVCDGACILNSNGDLGDWIFQGNNGTGSWLKGDKAILTIRHWSAENIEIARDDPPDSAKAGLTATYHGAVCGSSIKGTVVARWPGHFNDKDLTVPWTATIPVTTCDGISDDTLPLMDTARRAIRFRQKTNAFRCLSRAADLGERDARTAVGLMYRDGIGTQANSNEALRYLKQSAIQGDYNAQLAMSQMYEIGIGVPKDPAEAADWAKRAYNNPMAVAARQNREDAKDMQHMFFLGLSGLIEAMASPTVYIER